jgi:hypothetical protein
MRRVMSLSTRAWPWRRWRAWKRGGLVRFHGLPLWLLDQADPMRDEDQGGVAQAAKARARDLLHRNERRAASVPGPVIAKLARKLEIPDLTEAQAVEWVWAR